MGQTIDTRRLATAVEIAEHLGVTIQTLYGWRVKGYGPAGIRVGRLLRYRWADVEAWQAERTGFDVGPRGAA